MLCVVCIRLVGTNKLKTNKNLENNKKHFWDILALRIYIFNVSESDSLSVNLTNPSNRNRKLDTLSKGNSTWAAKCLQCFLPAGHCRTEWSRIFLPESKIETILPRFHTCERETAAEITKMNQIVWKIWPWLNLQSFFGLKNSQSYVKKISWINLVENFHYFQNLPLIIESKLDNIAQDPFCPCLDHLSIKCKNRNLFYFHFQFWSS